MTSVNQVFLLGRLGADAVTRRHGDRLASRCSLATDRRRKGADGTWTSETDWHLVTIWSARRPDSAEGIGQYLTKGSRIHVQGGLRTHSWIDETTGDSPLAHRSGGASQGRQPARAAAQRGRRAPGRRGPAAARPGHKAGQGRHSLLAPGGPGEAGAHQRTSRECPASHDRERRAAAALASLHPGGAIASRRIRDAGPIPRHASHRPGWEVPSQCSRPTALTPGSCVPVR